MAPRAPSARIAEQQRRAAEAAIAKLCDEATSTRRPAKKQKIIKQRETAVSAPRQDDFRKIKGRRGKLKVMTELPFDILLEIFGYLEPLDLLNISRATKELRAFITGENTTVLWKQVYMSFQFDSWLRGLMFSWLGFQASGVVERPISSGSSKMPYWIKLDTLCNLFVQP